MTIDRDRFLNLASAYVLNALDEKDRNTFEGLLQHAPDDLKRDYEKLKLAAQHLPVAINQKKPPSDIKEELITHIKELSDINEKELIPKPRTFFERIAHFIGIHRPQIAITIIVVLLIIAVGFIFFSSKLYYTDKDQQKNLVTLQSKLKEKNYLLSILQNPKINIIYLKGSSLDTSAYGKIIVNPANHRAMLLVTHLHAQNSSQFYQLWIQHNSGINTAGIFTITDTSESHYFAITNFKTDSSIRKDRYYITLEDSATAKSPSDRVYLQSK
ncbi:MAG TPA: anti-sigma factor [Balneolales bacterium]|nr:anti-sigma factor [Balneolales bacterium]